MEIRYSRGGLLGWIQERWFEFRQGHGTYLGFILSFVNFVLIAYSLFLEQGKGGQIGKITTNH